MHCTLYSAHVIFLTARLRRGQWREKLKILSPKVKHLTISEFTSKIQFLHYKVPLECGDEDMCRASLTMSDLALALQILKTKPHIVVRLVMSRLLCEAILIERFEAGKEGRQGGVRVMYCT